ncbi:MAG TPA: glycoside hydrolase family 15 protein [Longimicrobiaceae bacterium]|nr:glycoside hydrolase family 15 protein [Longimicrobiaceae bacterium]
MKGNAIEEHGVIGDLHTVALVGLDGTIDFMCAPSFDSPTVFAALLDRERGGCFELAPVLEGARRKQLYLPDTNVLLTRALSAGGVAEISDFMPVEAARGSHQVVRRAKAVRGEVRFRMRCAPRFDYARAAHRVEESEGAVVFVPEEAGCPALRLRASVPLRVENGEAHAEFTLAGERSAVFILEEARRGEAPSGDPGEYASRAFKRTVNFWRGWIGRSTYQGRWRDEVHRSALVLKLLVSRPHGSLVAAPTFSLPEALGGERNWDYRYTWIRDAAFTLYALIRLGMTEETGAFMRWIEARCAEPPANGVGPLQPLYGMDGRHALPETVLPHLRGYAGSRPVRIGNAAHGQLQLDIYGALLDSVYLYDKYGEPISYDFWCDLARLTDWVCENWRLPDEGIWEVRSGRREFLHSRILCWVAVDRAIRLAQKRSFPAPLVRWLEERDRIYRDIFENFWDPVRRTFVQYRGSEEVDAATLLMPLLRFISPRDPRWLSTLDAVRRTLLDDSLVYRYRVHRAAPDGFRDPEGTFSMCSFWYVECLSRAGDLQQARFLFEKMLGYANHLGLYAEQLGPSGEQLGNFPQAFTHLALISAAYDLDRRLTGAGWTA